ncbi:hypothetical protein [Streptomyces fulvoviolaceus]|uniref:hypothetical protein n=1 Tax=Streptomyces fulvoviolaceus TaxID=285535 RepID=UPI0009986820|nr:hypothetical protein [Streptomyces fulvoviolaceus]
MKKRQRHACVQGPTAPERLNGPEAVVIIIVIALGAVLAYAGMPVTAVMEILSGGGLIGAHVARRAPLAPGM